MTEIKKGTPVWVWVENKEGKSKAKYLCYDELSYTGPRHVCVLNGSRIGVAYAEPINETNDQALQLINEAKLKIAEAEKILNAQS